MSQPKYTPHQRRRIAMEALVSERTVIRWLAEPHSVSEHSVLRIERAIAALGMQQTLPTVVITGA